MRPTLPRPRPTPPRPRLSLPDPLERPRIALALGIGLAGGGAAYGAGLPLPWMLGSMAGCAVAALGGVGLRAPGFLRPVVIPIIGVMLGSGFDAGLYEAALHWGATLALMPVYLIVSWACSYGVFRYFGGYDRATAFYSAAPGGLNEMILMGEAAGGDARRITLAHSVRLFVTILAVALLFALVYGVRAAQNGAGWVSLAAPGWTGGAILLACALCGTWVGARLRLPVPGIFGPMLLSSAVHLGGLVSVPPPSLLLILAQVVLGTVLGCRFVGSSLRELGRDMALGLWATLLLLGIALVFALGLALATHEPVSQALLAYSPGGLTEMSLLALAMHQDVAYVSTAHMARIVMVLFLVPLVATRWFAPSRP